MKQCPECHSNVSSIALTCPYCLANLTSPKPVSKTESATTIEKKLCQSSNNEIIDDSGLSLKSEAKVEEKAKNLCQNCNSELPDGSSFCLTCGTKVGEKAKRFCQNCKSELPDGSAFCNKCGTSVGENVPQAPVSYAPPPPQPNPYINGYNNSYGYNNPYPNNNPFGHSPPDPEIDKLQHIVGDNWYYYREQFIATKRFGNSKFNVAAFFFGASHAFYRRLPIGKFIAYLIPCFLGLGIITAILLGCNFNKLYYQHCQENANNPYVQRGVSFGAAIGYGMILGLAVNAVFFLFFGAFYIELLSYLW